MKRIVVGTDGSAGADRAVEFAAGLAKQTGAELTVIHVIGGYLPGDAFARLSGSGRAWLDEQLRSLSGETLKHAQDRARGAGLPTVRLESRHGEVAAAILELAEEADADAIVVGKRGTSQLAGALLGSVSQKLASLSSRVVMVVP